MGGLVSISCRRSPQTQGKARISICLSMVCGLAFAVLLPAGRIPMRALSLVIIGLAMPVAAPATTLQRLTMDEIIQKSTSIVRAKVLGSHSAWRGPDIYTWYAVG